LVTPTDTNETYQLRLTATSVTTGSDGTRGIASIIINAP